VNVIATAQDGTTLQKYSLNIKRACSSDASLSNLVPSSSTLQPTFSTTALQYTVNIPNGVASIRLTPTKTHPLARTLVGLKTFIGFEGFLVDSGQASQKIDVPEGGSVTVLVEVIAQCGNMQTYQVTVNRGPSPVCLGRSLSLSGNTASGITAMRVAILPEFSSGSGTYNATVPFDMEEAQLEAAIEHPKSSVAITVPGQGGSSNPKRAKLVQNGNTDFTVTITAQDATTICVYTVKVYRPAPPPWKYQTVRGALRHAACMATEPESCWRMAHAMQRQRVTALNPHDYGSNNYTLSSTDGFFSIGIPFSKQSQGETAYVVVNWTDPYCNGREAGSNVIPIKLGSSSRDNTGFVIDLGYVVWSPPTEPCPTPPPVPPPPFPQVGKITGSLRDGSKLVHDATAIWDSPDLPDAINLIKGGTVILYRNQPKREVERKVVTNGFFTFENVPVGMYSIEGVQTGFFPGIVPTVSWEQQEVTVLLCPEFSDTTELRVMMSFASFPRATPVLHLHVSYYDSFDEVVDVASGFTGGNPEADGVSLVQSPNGCTFGGGLCGEMIKIKKVDDEPKAFTVFLDNYRGKMNEWGLRDRAEDSGSAWRASFCEDNPGHYYCATSQPQWEAWYYNSNVATKIKGYKKMEEGCYKNGECSMRHVPNEGWPMETSKAQVQIFSHAGRQDVIEMPNVPEITQLATALYRDPPQEAFKGGYWAYSHYTRLFCIQWDNKGVRIHRNPEFSSTMPQVVKTCGY
jgi:hypothetical protein